MPILPVVKADEGNYAQLRKTALKRIVKRKVKETEMKESEKIKDL